MNIFNPFHKYLNYGENVAARYLRRHGYKILDRNFRIRFGEIDIVAEKDNVIVIVEVKHRNSSEIYRPREAVDRSKQIKIKRTALFYITNKRLDKRYVRFDVVEVVGTRHPEIVHIKNAFI